MFCFLVHSNTTGATSFLFTEYQYEGIFMVVFAILIFLFLGSVEGLSTKTQQCTYDVHRMCKPALATALFSTVSFLLGAITSVLSGFCRYENRHICKHNNDARSKKKCRESIYYRF
ncbi:putative inorganic diphosphatase [Helianthus anomalus]